VGQVIYQILREQSLVRKYVDTLPVTSKEFLNKSIFLATAYVETKPFYLARNVVKTLC
jgi:hypothetical protein